MKRAMRCDKFTIAHYIQLKIYQDPKKQLKIPTLRFIDRTKVDIKYKLKEFIQKLGRSFDIKQN